MSTKRKILFVLPFLPYPMISGGHQALFCGIAAIQNDFQVHVAFLQEETPQYNENVQKFAAAIPGIVLYPLLYKRTQKRGLRHIVSKLFRRGQCCDSPIISRTSNWKFMVSPSNIKWFQHLGAIFAKEHFDIIQVELPERLSDIFALPSDCKKVYVHHELGFVRRNLEMLQLSNDIYAEGCRRFADFNEIGQLNLYDAVITLSATDKQKLYDKGVSTPIFSSFATIRSSDRISTPKGTGRHLTTIAPDFHYPNFAGVSWFLDNCWPVLKDRDETYTLDIIGKWSDAHIREFTAKYRDVHFLGFVDDLSAALDDSIMIVPITIGSGIRMKILEASANGIPFVSTSVGAEGLPLEDGQDCYITDDPMQFVEHIVRLQQLEIRQKFSRNAHDKITRLYSVAALRENRLNIYNTILSGD